MKKITAVLYTLFILLLAASCSQAAICDDTDALELVRNTIMHASQAGPEGSERLQPIQDIYKNKWLISCAVANGVTNLDKAGDYLLQPDTVTSYTNLVISRAGGNGSIASSNVRSLAESMKNLSKTPAFQHSVVDRTRVIGMYILLLAFLIGIASKLYALILGADNSDAIDFALLFIRFMTILLFISFMKPLAFYGMQISTLVSNMLLEAPIQIVVSTNVGYTGPGALFEGQSYSTPWFGNSLQVTSRYGIPRDVMGTGRIRTHHGVDFAASVGTRVTAPYTGTASCKQDPGGFGTYIEVIPSDSPNERHIAGHLSSCRYEGDSELAEDFRKGKPIPVSAGEGVGLSGNSGRSTGPHIHLEVRYGGVPKDPGIVYAARSGAAGVTTTQPGTGSPVDTGGLQAGSNVSGAYAYEGNDALTVDALFHEIMRLKSMTLNAKDSFSLWDLMTGGFTYFFTYIAAWLARVIAGAVLSVLIILADCMMAITLALGPIVAALTLVPPFENYLQHWIKGYVTFLFYQPLAACFTVLSFVIMVVTMDTGFTGFLILTVCYVMGCMKIPSIADGLSTSALVGVAMMMAFAPAMLLVKSAAAGAGALIGGAGGASAADGIASGIMDAGGAAAGNATGPKASSGGRDGFLKTGALLPALMLAVVLLCCGCASAESISVQDKKDLMNILKPVRYPSPALVNDVMAAVDKYSQLSGGEGGMTQVGDSGVSVYNDGDEDNDMNGIYNTSYIDAIDMPMTRFVLGKADVDASMVYEMAFMSSYNKKLDDANARELSTFLLENSFLGNTASVVSIIGKVSTTLAGAASSIGADVDQLRGEIRAKGDRVSAFLLEAQDAIVTKLMFWVPVYILILMFFIQLGVISYIKVVEPTIGDRASYVMTVPRLVLFLMFIYFFKEAAGVCITFSNYISNAIVPIETQRSLMANITSKTGGLIPGQEISGLMVTIFRTLTYMSVKILLMARDMFMTITVIVGPTCIALGYFTRYRNPDYIHQFFTGWIENFIKLLFWGPLAAVMLFCLGILSVLTALDMMSVISVAVTALAFLYAAGNIPNLAEKMSSVAIGGLLVALSPMIAKGLMFTGRGATSGTMMGGALLRKFGGMLGVNAALGGGFGKAGGLYGRFKNGIMGAVQNPLSKFDGIMGGNGKIVPSSSVPSDMKAPKGMPVNKSMPGTGLFPDDMLKAAQSGAAGTAAGIGQVKASSSMKPVSPDTGTGAAGKDDAIKTAAAMFEESNSGLMRKNALLGGLITGKKLPGAKLGCSPDGGDVSQCLGNMTEAFSAGKAVDMAVSGRMKLSDMFFGNSLKNSLINSQEFAENSGISGEPEAAKAALLGMLSLRTARMGLEHYRNKISADDYRLTNDGIRNAARDLEGFIKGYTSGAFKNIPESELRDKAVSIAAAGIERFDGLYEKTAGAVRPVSARGTAEGLPRMLEYRDFGSGPKEIEKAVKAVSERTGAGKASELIRSGAYGAKDLFMGSGVSDGMINHEGFMMQSGLAAEPAPIRAAITGIIGLRTAEAETALLRGTADPGLCFRTSETLRLTEAKLEDFVKTYTAGGFADIAENELTSDVMAMTSDALGAFDTLNEASRPQERAVSETGMPSGVQVQAGSPDLPYSVPLPDDIVSSLPMSARSWLSGNAKSAGAARMVHDIRSCDVPPQSIFGAPFGSEESRSVFAGYDMTPPSNMMENTAFQLFGLGVMRDAASECGSRETADRINESVSHIKDIIKQGGADDGPAIDGIYSAGGSDDPVLGETRSAAEYYSEHVSERMRQTDPGTAGAAPGNRAAGSSGSASRARRIGRWSGDMMKDLDRLVKESEHYGEEVGSIESMRSGKDNIKISDGGD